MHRSVPNFVPVIEMDEGLASHCLQCPVCSSLDVHQIALDCRSPGTERGHVHIDANGIIIDTEAQGACGVVTRFSFQCERGHLFEFALFFDKGRTRIGRRLNEIPVTTDDVPRTIWRET